MHPLSFVFVESEKNIKQKNIHYSFRNMIFMKITMVVSFYLLFISLNFLSFSFRYISFLMFFTIFLVFVFLKKKEKQPFLYFRLAENLRFLVPPKKICCFAFINDFNISFPPNKNTW